MGYPYRIASRAEAPASMRAALESHPPAVMLPIPYIGIYCDAESHAGDLWLCASFTPSIEAGQVHWGRHPYYPTRSGDLLWIGTVGTSGLVGNDVTDVNDAYSRGDAAEFRHRHEIRCGLCGLVLPRRSENIQADMTALANAGVLELSLRAYVATITSKSGRH